MSENIKIGGQIDAAREGHWSTAASGEEAKRRVPVMANLALPLAATITALMRLQKRRTFCIEMQSVMDRKTDSMLVYDVLEMPHDTPKGARKKWYGEAAKLRHSIEKHGGVEGQTLSADGQDIAALSAAVPLILAAGQFRTVFDSQRDNIEAEMRRLAEGLPAYAWWCAIEGCDALGIAAIVAEVGDIGALRTKTGKPDHCVLWKLLGWAPKGAYPKSDKGIAMVPKSRQGRIFGTVMIPIFMRQSVVKGIYRQAYDYRRARTALTHPEWTTEKAKHPGRTDKDAKRYMLKRLLRDLWKAWRREASSGMPETASHRLPPTAN